MCAPYLALALATVTGTVFVDADRDGALDAGEAGVATTVSWEGARFARSDADGRYAIEIPGDGIVWARVPDGFVPGPSWGWATGDAVVDLPLVPLPAGVADTPLTFIVAADTHLHAGAGNGDLAAALAQATALEPAPRFVTILGDVTQANQPDELDQIAAAIADLAVPWVPVAGNHDWYDGGAAWRARFGPESYSFEIGAVHFVVANTTADDEAIAGYLSRELADVDPARTIVLLAHAPLSAAVVEVMEARGVDLYLAGHWHANRAWDHGALLELDTGPLLMGGIDLLPAGYRIVTIDGRGTITVDHRTMVREPWLRLAGPLGCAAPGAPLIAAAEADARDLAITATIDGAEIPLAPAGGWAHAGALPALPRGRHPVQLEARAGGALVARADVAV
jgi:predicted phosphodiesterase